MKFQDDISMPHTHTHTRTSRKQYVPHFFKVGGIKIWRKKFVFIATKTKPLPLIVHIVYHERKTALQLAEEEEWLQKCFHGQIFTKKCAERGCRYRVHL